MKTIEIYLQDLTPEKQAEILETLGDNGNYDVFPIATIEFEDKKVRYHVYSLGYDENNCITDYEQDFGDFNTYGEAYEEFVKLQRRDAGWFFEDTPNLYQLLLQLEECEEDDDESNCVDVKNEWWIVNPNFKEEM